MKNLKILSIIIMLLLVVFGCEDILVEVPESQISPESFFKDGQDAEALVLGAYDALQSGNYYGRYMIAANMHAGAISYSRSGSRTPTSHYIDNLILNQSRSNRPLWPGFYEGIKRANTVFAFVPDIEMNEVLKEQVLGEAYFLRGMHNLNLVRYFGSAPIVNELAQSADPDEFLFEKSSVTDLYAQVISDLNNAISRLDIRANTGAGRASKEAAQAILMRAYWSRAVDQEAAQSSDWESARNLGLGLLSSFELDTDYSNLFGEGDDNPEVLFEVNYTRTKGESQPGSIHATYAPEFSGLGAMAWGTAHTRIPFWNTFRNDDVRKEVTFLTEYIDKNNNVVPWWEFVSAKAPHFKKWIDFEQVESNSPFNIPVIRGADILLMLAEIENEINGGPNANAYDYIDQIRNRAGIPLLIGSGLSQEQFRDSVLYERRRELACEGAEFVDLAHFGADKMEELVMITSYTNNDEGIAKMKADIPVDDLAQIMALPDANQILEGIFGRQIKTEIIEWDDHNIRFAIPQGAVDANPNLAKNDPYRPGG